MWAIAVVLCGVCGATRAADAEVSVDVNSAYVWRGITLTDGPVLQPSLDVTLPAGLAINVWANMDLNGANGDDTRREFSETDLQLSYTYDRIERFAFSVGVIEYLFSHQTQDNEALPGTRELFAGVSALIGWGFSAGVEGFYDIDEVKDYYAYVSLTYEYELMADTLTAAAELSAGVAGEDWAAEIAQGTSGGLFDYGAKVTLTYQALESLKLAAHVAYAGSLDKDVLPDQAVNVYGGINATYSF